MKLHKVNVQFRDPFDKTFRGKSYGYLSFEKLSIGDLVVVETVYGLSVAKVSYVVTTVGNFESSSYVVSRIDTSELEAKKLKVAQAEMIKAEIEEKIREHLYKKQLSEFAKDDQEIADLVKQLENL